MKRSKYMLQKIYLITLALAILMAANVFVVSVGKFHINSQTDLNPYIDSVSFIKKNIYANRGLIFDSNGIVVAQDEEVYNIICFLDEGRIGLFNKPAYIEDLEYTSRVLATILETEPEDIYSILSNAKMKGYYQTEIGNIGRNLSEETKLKIEEYAIPGVEFTTSDKRYYPLGDYFSPYLVGFAQADENGKLIIYTIEEYIFNRISIIL